MDLTLNEAQVWGKGFASRGGAIRRLKAPAPVKRPGTPPSKLKGSSDELEVYSLSGIKAMSGGVGIRGLLFGDLPRTLWVWKRCDRSGSHWRHAGLIARTTRIKDLHRDPQESHLKRVEWIRFTRARLPLRCPSQGRDWPARFTVFYNFF